MAGVAGCLGCVDSWCLLLGVGCLLYVFCCTSGSVLLLFGFALSFCWVGWIG